jgi:hypothetical protein
MHTSMILCDGRSRSLIFGQYLSFISQFPRLLSLRRCSNRSFPLGLLLWLAMEYYTDDDYRLPTSPQLVAVRPNLIPDEIPTWETGSWPEDEEIDIVCCPVPEETTLLPQENMKLDRIADILFAELPVAIPNASGKEAANAKCPSYHHPERPRCSGS